MEEKKEICKPIEIDCGYKKYLKLLYHVQKMTSRLDEFIPVMTNHKEDGYITLFADKYFDCNLTDNQERQLKTLDLWELLQKANDMKIDDYRMEHIDYAMLDRVFSSWLTGSDLRGSDSEEIHPFGNTWAALTPEQQAKHIEALQEMIINMYRLDFCFRDIEHNIGASHVRTEDTDLWTACMQCVSNKAPSRLSHLLNIILKRKEQQLNNTDKLVFSSWSGVQWNDDITYFLQEIEEIQDTGILDRKGFEIPALILKNMPEMLFEHIKEKIEESESQNRKDNELLAELKTKLPELKAGKTVS